MKRMSAVAAAQTGGEAAPVGGTETGRHRAYEICYSATRPSTALLRTSVLIEMGVRGGDHPREVVQVGRLLGDVLAGAGVDLGEYADLEPFDVAILHPGRTLIEKLVLVHGEAQRLHADPERVPDARVGRHFYDIGELLQETPVRELLLDRDEFDRILEEIDEITRTHFASARDEMLELRPLDGFAASRAFQPDDQVSQRLRAAYEATMPELFFGSGPLPSWEAICERVRGAAELL